MPAKAFREVNAITPWCVLVGVGVFLVWAGVMLVNFTRIFRKAGYPWALGLLMVVGLLATALGRDIPRYYPILFAAAWILLREPEALLGARHGRCQRQEQAFQLCLS